MATHDYTSRGWGHDYTFEPIENGKRGSLTGWGRGIKKGDYLILENGNQGSRYQVTSIRYYSDPSDMWKARATFKPRKVKALA